LNPIFLGAGAPPCWCPWLIAKVYRAAPSQPVKSSVLK
jgi:hypothetical protein